MPTVIIVRHGHSTSNGDGTLAGRTPGIHLSDKGREQAARLAERFAGATLARVVSSPLERCKETAKAITSAHPQSLRIATEKGITECDYGDWQGRPIKELLRLVYERKIRYVMVNGIAHIPVDAVDEYRREAAS